MSQGPWWPIYSHFFQPILLKISGNVHNGKNRNHVFCFSVRWKATKIFAFEYFWVFLAVHVCLTSEDYQIFPAHWIEHREFESADFAENFRECPQWRKQKSRFFLFLCKMKGNKDICIWIFLSFFSSVCLTSEDYQIFPVHRIEHREFESAKKFWLSLLVFEIEGFFGLTVRNNNVMTSVEKQKFSCYKIM